MDRFCEKIQVVVQIDNPVSHGERLGKKKAFGIGFE
jgi:hypothetical protein